MDWTKVTRSDACWLWNGPALLDDGRTPREAAWDETYGPRPPKTAVAPRTRFCLRACVRPDHLCLVPAGPRGRRAGRSFGARNGRARLTEADVRAIRHRAAMGETQTALAREFGVSQGQVSKLVRRRGWEQVP